jgi:polar amino acid transport system substrate-binding protein
MKRKKSATPPLALALACLFWLGLSAGFAPAMAQPQPPSSREGVVIPFHGDPRVRVERPEGPVPRNLRVVTDDEFPPLHFADPDGQPVGFSVDLMRAVCERLGVNCTIQVRRFDLLLPALAEGQADIAAAAIPVTAQLKARFHVSRVYHRFPARFVARRGFEAGRLDAGAAGLRVAVARGSAHAAFLAEHFPRAAPVEAPDPSAALAALGRGDVDLAFCDGQAAALWLGARGLASFGFAGGPYYSIPHFGEGIGFVLRPDEPHLKRAVDFALQGLWDDGTYARLFLRYFPVSPF